MLLLLESLLPAQSLTRVAVALYTMTGCALASRDIAALAECLQENRALVRLMLDGQWCFPLSCRLQLCALTIAPPARADNHGIGDKGARYLAEALEDDGCKLRSLSLKGTSQPASQPCSTTPPHASAAPPNRLWHWKRWHQAPSSSSSNQYHPHHAVSRW